MRYLVPVLKWLGTIAALAAAVACFLDAILGWRWFGGEFDSNVAVLSLIPHVATLRYVVVPWLTERGVGRMSFNQKRAVLAVPFGAWLVCGANVWLGWRILGRYGAVAAAFASLALGDVCTCLPITLEEIERFRRERDGTSDR